MRSGSRDFPTMGANGGNLAGLTVITSETVGGDTSGHNIYFIKQNEVFLADDGAVSLDSSREATLDMAGSTTAVYSLWQRNSRRHPGRALDQLGAAPRRGSPIHRERGLLRPAGAESVRGMTRLGAADEGRPFFLGRGLMRMTLLKQKLTLYHPRRELVMGDTFEIT